MVSLIPLMYFAARRKRRREQTVADEDIFRERMSVLRMHMAAVIHYREVAAVMSGRTSLPDTTCFVYPTRKCVGMHCAVGQ